MNVRSVPPTESQLNLPVASVTPSPSTTPTPTLPPLPQQKILPGGIQVFQTFNNCGPAALSMALSHYGQTVSQQQLGQELRPYQHPTGDNDDKSVTLAEIAAQAEEYGLVAYHRPAGNAHIIKQFLALDLPVMTRTWLKPNEDIGHYRVIKGFDENTQEFIQDDSLQGANLRYSYDAFAELWRPFNYEFVVLVPPEKQTEAELILGELVNENDAWQQSLALAEMRLAEQPDDIYAAFNKSVALYRLERYADSIEAYESVETRLPARMLWYQLEPLLAYFKLGRNEKVLAIADTILNRHNRAYSELYYLKSLIYRQQNNLVAADQAIKQAEMYNQSGSWKINVPRER